MGKNLAGDAEENRESCILKPYIARQHLIQQKQHRLHPNIQLQIRDHRCPLKTEHLNKNDSAMTYTSVGAANGRASGRLGDGIMWPGKKASSSMTSLGRHLFQLGSTSLKPQKILVWLYRSLLFPSSNEYVLQEGQETEGVSSQT